jgi:hypothetical protein
MRLGGSILDADFTSGVGPFYAPITRQLANSRRLFPSHCCRRSELSVGVPFIIYCSIKRNVGGIE